jgi:protein-S-isoprenylcysteine O-methyltransferase Ste14
LRRASATAGTLVFAATVPATVAWAFPRWLAERASRDDVVVGPSQRWVGTALVAAGLPLVVDAFVRFVRARGTPAPIAETEDLVTSGPYGRTRNPQYVGVVAMVVGQGLRWNSGRVLSYAAGLVVAFDTWVRVYEEPRLRARFGDDFERYLRRVPRWIGRTARSMVGEVQASCASGSGTMTNTSA